MSEIFKADIGSRISFSSSPEYFDYKPSLDGLRSFLDIPLNQTNIGSLRTAAYGIGLRLKTIVIRRVKPISVPNHYMGSRGENYISIDVQGDDRVKIDSEYRVEPGISGRLNYMLYLPVLDEINWVAYEQHHPGQTLNALGLLQTGTRDLLIISGELQETDPEVLFIQGLSDSQRRERVRYLTGTIGDGIKGVLNGTLEAEITKLTNQRIEFIKNNPSALEIYKSLWMLAGTASEEERLAEAKLTQHPLFELDDRLTTLGSRQNIGITYLKEAREKGLIR